MSSTKNQSSLQPQDTSPNNSQAAEVTEASLSHTPSIAEPVMDQHLESSLSVSSAPPTLEVMSSTESESAPQAASPVEASQPESPAPQPLKAKPTRPQPVESAPEPPASKTPTSPAAPTAPAAPPASESAAIAAPAVESTPTVKTSVKALIKTPAEAPAETPAETPVTTAEATSETLPLRQQPIPPASEPMQYRAIGLVRGKYLPSEEQFTRGAVQTDDGAIIDAVLLGRVMSLVKKHIELSDSHLWVVYPRTREATGDLHIQIVGVWEPEKLNRMDDVDVTGDDAATDEAIDDDETDDDAIDNDETDDDATDDVAIDEVTAADDTEAAVEVATAETAITTAGDETRAEASRQALDAIPPEDLNDRYFSIRGEVIFQSMEDKKLLVKIRRATPQSGPPKDPKQSKPFKILLQGTVEGRAVGCFWDFNVERHGSDLIIQESSLIGTVPVVKRKPGVGGGRPMGGRGGPRRPGGGGGRFNRDSSYSGGGGGPRRPGGGGGGGRFNRDNRSNDRSFSERPQTSAPRQPVGKPIKRRKDGEGEQQPPSS